MGRIVVGVISEPEILDPQGKAVVGSLPRLGLEQFVGVRRGRRFELTVDGLVTEEHLAAVHEAADALLFSPIIEGVASVTVDEEAWTVSESLSSSPAARVDVITFPGTPDNIDAARAVCLAGAEPVNLWYKDADLRGVDAVVVLGGFSYGDYLRCGAIACFVPVMKEVAAVAERGMPVLSICNGFQILAKAHFSPGALLRNANQRFIRVEQYLRVENTQITWINRYVDGDEIIVPMKNGEDNFIVSSEKLDRLEGEGLVTLRYVGNPNGSARDIAGVYNERGSVVGLMPHPEHTVEPGFDPDSQTGPRTGTDGLGAFRSAIDPLLAA